MRVIVISVVISLVDLRKNSPTYLKIWSVYLSEENKRQFFVPRGFAHGFISLKDNTIFQYKCDNFYNKESEDAILWCDETLPIYWTQYVNMEDIKVSDKDKLNKHFSEIDNPF